MARKTGKKPRRKPHQAAVAPDDPPASPGPPRPRPPPAASCVRRERRPENLGSLLFWVLQAQVDTLLALLLAGAFYAIPAVHLQAKGVPLAVRGAFDSGLVVALGSWLLLRHSAPGDEHERDLGWSLGVVALFGVVAACLAVSIPLAQLLLPGLVLPMVWFGLSPSLLKTLGIDAAFLQGAGFGLALAPLALIRLTEDGDGVVAALRRGLGALTRAPGTMLLAVGVMLPLLTALELWATGLVLSALLSLAPSVAPGLRAAVTLALVFPLHFLPAFVGWGAYLQVTRDRAP